MARKIVRKERTPAELKAADLNDAAAAQQRTEMKERFKPVLLTQAGYQEVLTELENLRTAKRMEIAERVRESQENDVGHDSFLSNDGLRNEQAMNESRIMTLENMIRNAQIIDNGSARHSDSARLGSTAVLEAADGVRRTFTLVGRTEAAPADGRISNESPLGRALMGKRVRDDVEVMAPSGIQYFTVISIM